MVGERYAGEGKEGRGWVASAGRFDGDGTVVAMAESAEHRLDPAVERAAAFIQQLATHKTDEPRIAYPMERLLARPIDGCIWFGIFLVCSAAGYYFHVWFVDNPGVRVGTTGLRDNAPLTDPVAGWLTFSVAVALVLAFELVPTARSGRTWAKRRLRLRVVGPDGKPPGLARATLRFLVWFAPGAAFHLWWSAQFGTLTGLLAMAAQFAVLVIPGWIFWSDDHRGLHDVLAGTRVLSDR